MRLAIGVSTAFDTTAGVPDAYGEACLAIQSLLPGEGMIAPPGLSASTISPSGATRPRDGSSPQ